MHSALPCRPHCSPAPTRSSNETARVHRGARQRGGWPVLARAQLPSVPVVGFLNSGSPGALPDLLEAFHKGLGDGGFLVGQNVVLDFRWAEGRFDMLAGLAADLVGR